MTSVSDSRIFERFERALPCELGPLLASASGEEKRELRRYLGDGTKPLLPDHDRTEPATLLTPNQTYRIRITVANGVTEYWRNGERIFSFADPSPLRSGWFALRTVRSHLVIRNLELRTSHATKR